MRLQVPTSLLLFASCSSIADAQGTDLGGGLITRTDVEAYADLSLDLRDIRSYDSSEAILRIYNEGHNAELQPGVKFRLHDISGLLSGAESSTPNYLFHLYGLADLSSDSLSNFHQYADSFIRSTIDTNRASAAEAITALSLWMYGTHLLLWGVDNCAKRSVADNPDMLETLSGGGWDEFIALWIGKYQTPASFEGHGLYSWAQEIGEMFGTDDPEVNVNSELKLLYQEGAGILSLTHACSKENTDSVQQLWIVGQQMISQMFVPLFQRLIYAIHQRDENLVALYATALIPQLSQCRPSMFKRLKEKLMNGQVNFDRADEILDELKQVYSCFGLTCEDIGSYGDEKDTCSATENSYPALAGYAPTTNVQELSRIDLDILQLKILSSMETADSFSFPRYLYTFGKNSVKPRNSENDPVEFISLDGLATSAKRRMANPTFSQFESYFNEENYAQKAVRSLLDENSKWGAPAQRTEAIVIISAYQIIFMAFLTELSEAVEQCKKPNPDGMHGEIHPWDEVAAFLIGSLEGPGEGGSADQADGQLIWSLGNNRGFQFQTMSDSGYSEANAEILDLLFAGKGELDALDCNSLQWTANRLEKVASISIVQSAIRYAILSGGLTADSDHTDLAVGETFALSILPILAAVDRQSAEVIEENMIVRDGVQPVAAGPQVVAEAFATAMAQWGVDCHDIGSTSEIDPCRHNPRTSSSVPRPAPVRSASPSVRVGLRALLLSISFGVIVDSLYSLL